MTISLKAQYNLVPNPSFEIYDTCPNNGGQIKFVASWTNPLYQTTPDYFNSCSPIQYHVSVPENYLGYEYAHTGNAFMDIVTYTHGPNPLANDYREYLQVKLTDSLIGGVDYCIRFYVSAADSCRYISDNIGIYFSSIQVHDTCQPYPCNLHYIPQFQNLSTNHLNNRNGWTEVSGTYNATGGEKYIILGNFKDSFSTVATYTGWGINNFAVYYIDDVLISPCDSLNGILENQIPKVGIKLFPIPTDKEIKIESKDEIDQIQIYSIIGELLYTDNEKHPPSITTIDVSKFSKGLYSVSILTRKNKYNLKIIVN